MEKKKKKTKNFKKRRKKKTKRKKKDIFTKLYSSKVTPPALPSFIGPLHQHGYLIFTDKETEPQGD